MAIAFNSLRHKPDANLAQSMENRLKTLQGRKQSNKTAEYLSKSNPKIAEMLKQGIIDPKTAVSMLGKEKPSSLAERMALWLKDPDMFARMKEAGVISGNGVNIDMGTGDKAWYDTINKAVVSKIGDYEEGANTASASMNSFSQLSQALKNFGATGTFEEQKQSYRELADKFGLGSFIDYDKMAAGQTVVAFTNMTVANELRKNKGPQTDFDAIFAKSYVPSLGNKPEANLAITNYGTSIATQKQLLGDIARNASLERPEEARKIIKNLQDIEAHLPGAIQSPNGKWLTFIEYYNDPARKEIPAMDRMLTWANAYREEKGLKQISIYQAVEGF